jgi:hypothetical protein
MKENTNMANVTADSAFVRRLAAAARAAWWTFLIGVGLATAQFLAYAALSHCEAFWSGMAGFMWVEPQELRLLFLRFMFAVRLGLFVVAMGAIFLSLWACRLRRIGDA